ncbi:hypothetical protein YC2023_089895 [Brassica napus]
MCYTVPYPIVSLEGSPVQGRHMFYAAEQLVLDICNPELRENALHEFSKVDKPSCSTPRKRPNDIPSIESIEANGDAKEQQHLIRAFSVYAAAVSDSRSPLSAVN